MPTQGIDHCSADRMNSVSCSLSSCAESGSRKTDAQKRADQSRIMSRIYSPCTSSVRTGGCSKMTAVGPFFVYCGPGSMREPSRREMLKYGPHLHTNVAEISRKRSSTAPSEIRSSRRSARKLGATQRLIRSRAYAIGSTPILPGCQINSVSTKPIGDNDIDDHSLGVNTIADSSLLSDVSPIISIVVSSKTYSTYQLEHSKHVDDVSEMSKLLLHSGDNDHRAIWYGPDIHTAKAHHWLFVSNVNPKPTSNDVVLSGLLVLPATYAFSDDDSRKGILLEPERLYGMIRVLNRSYEKHVTIRASHDRWESYIDEPARYFSSSMDTKDPSWNKFDNFLFGFVLPEHSSEFEFAIHYRWSNDDVGREKHQQCHGSAWDNNGGQNYLLKRKQHTGTDPFSLLKMTNIKLKNYP